MALRNLQSPQIPTAPGYRVNDRRGGNQPIYPSNGRTSTLFEGGTANTQRMSITDLCYDTTRNVSVAARRTLMTAGRWLFGNFSVPHGTVLEQALFSTAGFYPQFWGDDKAWGDKAENWLLNWDNICMVEGWPYDGLSYRDMLVIGAIRDGDIGTLLTSFDGDYPAIQMIPAHRVGGRYESTTIIGDGDYKDRRVFDGVIVNDQRRPLAFQVYDEQGSMVVDTPSADSFFLSYLPQWPDQIRGFSELASAVFDWQDLRESKQAELVAQKAASKIALMEWNETGQRDVMNSIVKTARTSNTDGTPSGITQEVLKDGTLRYLRAGSGSKLEAFAFNRPGAQVQQYQADVTRDNIYSLMWSHFLSIAPNTVGGASMRIVVEKINRTVRKRQAMIVKALRRVHGYAIAKAMKLGLLPQSDEWWKWDYQLPAEITADRKYDSAVDIEELSNKMTTLKKVCAKRGDYWEDTQDQWLLEQKRLQDKAKKMGVDLTAVAGPDGKVPPKEEEEAEEDDPKRNGKKDDEEADK